MIRSFVAFLSSHLSFGKAEVCCKKSLEKVFDYLKISLEKTVCFVYNKVNDRGMIRYVEAEDRAAVGGVEGR